MIYNKITNDINQNKSPKSIITAEKWNQLFNTLATQSNHLSEWLTKVIGQGTSIDDLLSSGQESLVDYIVDQSGGASIDYGIDTPENPKIGHMWLDTKED